MLNWQDYYKRADKASSYYATRGPYLWPRLKRNHLNKSRRYAGLELEFTSLEIPRAEPLMEAVEKWRHQLGSDGSVSGMAIELRMSPTAGDVLAVMVREITDCLKEARAQTDKSAGLHVHVDLRDFSRVQLRQLLLLYAKYEMEFITAMPAARVMDGYYCRPSGRWLAAGLFPRKLYYNSMDVAIGEKSRGKYYAFNFGSYRQRQTVEIRMHPSVLTFDEIFPWVAGWAAFVDAAKKIPITKIDSMTEDLDGLSDILPQVSVDYLAKMQKANKWTDRQKLYAARGVE